MQIPRHPKTQTPNADLGPWVIESLGALEAAAASWAGTPFCEFSAVKGAGVCCHALPLECLFEAGWLPRFEYPKSSPRAAKVEKADAFHAAAAAAYFTSVALVPSVLFQPGDILQFQLGRTSHFVLVLPGRFFHAVQTHGAIYAESLQAHWLKRLVRIWRPKHG